MTYIPDALRELVIERAHGHCEYCLIHRDLSPITHEVDHVIPKKHRGKTESENLCFACFDCNRRKGSDFASFDPETSELVLLFNPRTQVWSEHFRLAGARIEPITPEGRVTVFVLKLNDAIRVRVRQAFLQVGQYPPK